MCIENKTDYEQWKDWFAKWNVPYSEETWNPEIKELVVDGFWSFAAAQFDLNNNFLCLTSYE